MLARVVRSGVVEAYHDGAVAAVEPDGTLVAWSGDIERRYLMRSSAKPFQVKVAIEHGADLAPEQIAVGAASHGGQPIHLAYVRSMLAEVGLDERFLGCPAAWPYVDGARDRLVAAGHSRPRAMFHNCSGKHAAMLRACVASGWPVETYLDPDHPLQQANRAEIERMTGQAVGDAAVDGCGAPVFEVSTLGTALAFARFGSLPQYRGIWWAMHRFAALTGDWDEAPAAAALWADVAAKGGAEGMVGLATRHDLGIAIKCWDGSPRPIGTAILATLDQLGLAPLLTRPYGESRLRTPVMGGGEEVGVLEPQLQLS